MYDGSDETPVEPVPLRDLPYTIGLVFFLKSHIFIQRENFRKDPFLVSDSLRRVGAVPRFFF
ncbi:hypothetical protein EBZ80_01330 [bacterium]|nr:hypothetical protein [bacterium]